VLIARNEPPNSVSALPDRYRFTAARSACFGSLLAAASAFSRAIYAFTAACAGGVTVGVATAPVDFGTDVEDDGAGAGDEVLDGRDDVELAEATGDGETDGVCVPWLDPQPATSRLVVPPSSVAISKRRTMRVSDHDLSACGV